MQIKITLNNVLYPVALKAKSIELGLALELEAGMDFVFRDYPQTQDADEVQETIVLPLMAASPGCWSTTEYAQ
jgi:hypothetical protein